MKQYRVTTKSAGLNFNEAIRPQAITRTLGIEIANKIEKSYGVRPTELRFSIIESGKLNKTAFWTNTSIQIYEDGILIYENIDGNVCRDRAALADCQ